VTIPTSSPTPGYRIALAVLALAIGLGITTRTLAADEPASEAGMGERLQACSGCHGERGRSDPEHAYFPAIAGKPAGYLFEQLINFKKGRRHHDIMQSMFAVLSDQYLQDIAEYYAGQTPRHSAAVSHPAAETRGAETLVFQGAPDRDIPACAACHGKALTGALPTIPGLLGLRSEYLAAQLGAWREGTRRAAAPDCMHTIAQRLRSDEIDRVSKWLASQPYPTGAKPLPQLPDPLPIPCGASR